MTLTLQFLLVSTLPASFLILALYSLRARRRRPRVTRRWILVLVAAAAWSSSALIFYGGQTMARFVDYNWQLIGTYSLSLLPLLLLLATIALLKSSTPRARFTVWLSLFLWLAAVALDPDWIYELPTLNLSAQTITHTNIWSAVWMTSWLLPSVATWFLTQRAARHAPGPLYRNQINYWLLSVSLFILGSGAGVTRDLVWQQLGAFVAIVAGLVGTISLTRSRLPNLRLAIQRLMGRLLGATLIFGLTWLALRFISQTALDSLTNLGVVFPSIMFAVAVVLIYHLFSQLTNRLFLPAPARRSVATQEQFAAANAFLAPEPLAALTLRLIQASLSTDDAWIMRLEDGPGGRTILRPLASLRPDEMQAVAFQSASPFIDHLQQEIEPLNQYDIDTFDAFRNITDSERQQIEQWQRVAYAPIRIGERLLGVIGIGAKYSDEQYEERDMATLREITRHISPLLAHTTTMASLQRLNSQLFDQNQELIRDRLFLRELTAFYSGYLSLLSPELREPFQPIDIEMLALRAQLGDDQVAQACLDEMDKELDHLKSLLSGLLTSVPRVQKQNDYHFELVNADELIRQALHNLAAMAEARKVELELVIVGNLRPVYGDPQPLTEAIQQLVHNAIKFNKIGGHVRVECALAGPELTIGIVDNGVGLPEDRLEQVLAGFGGVEQLSANPMRGTGMGLPLARFIIQAHGGRLEATSKHGSGSTFSIHLPVTYDKQLNGAKA